MLPSTHCSCHWDHSDTTDSHSVYPSPCTKWIHQMVANLQAWTKFITWQGPQVGTPGVLVNTIFWLAPQACMMHSISFEGNFSFFLKWKQFSPQELQTSFWTVKIKKLNPVLWKKEQFHKHILGFAVHGGLQGHCHWLIPLNLAWILCWLYFLPSPAP